MANYMDFAKKMLRGTVVQIMASLNEAIEKKGLKQEEPEMKMKSQ